MLSSTAVMYISFRTWHLDCVLTPSQALIVIYCKPVVALISSGIGSLMLTQVFSLQASLAVTPNKGARLIKRALISVLI